MTITICIVLFLSTLSLRRATSRAQALSVTGSISIHALLAESDPPRGGSCYLDNIISIHALLAESDGVHYDNYNLHCVISIHALLAESDRAASITPTASRNFYPRSPCGERRIKPIFRKINTRDFYPRSPCGERRKLVKTNTCKHLFLSTLSLRRATTSSTVIVILRKNFYPRSPCGERPSSAGRL